MNIGVEGGQVLNGEIDPSGSKNSAVALIPASLLFDKPVVFRNMPDISDVDRLVKIMSKLGSRIVWNKETTTMILDNSNVNFTSITNEDLGSMKGTSLLWGPLLARFGTVDFSDLPGGCTLGERPLDAHYEAFQNLGVVINDNSNGVYMNSKGAEAGTILLTEMSPTATENVIMLATSLKGTTRIMGAASEPQVQDLCNFLAASGSNIKGIGSNILEIEGGRNLTAIEHSLLSDHYEIATFMALAAITGGEIKINNALKEFFPQINYVFRRFGVEVEYEGNSVVVRKDQKIKINTGNSSLLTVRPQPWPGLPVDLLPIFIPLALADGGQKVLYHNWMYETGLDWTSELTKLHADVFRANPHQVIVTGGKELNGATMEAPYIIRAVVAMVMSAMIAEGKSKILNADALYRGHPHFAENLNKLGAKIEEQK